MSPEQPSIASGTTTSTTSRGTGRRSGRSQPVELITRSDRRRWTLEQKRAIVAESFDPDLTPTQVARKHEISSGQLYTWRREILGLHSTPQIRSSITFAAVETAEPTSSGVTSSSLPTAGASPIEIILPGGITVRVDAQVDARALHCVLEALRTR